MRENCICCWESSAMMSCRKCSNSKVSNCEVWLFHLNQRMLFIVFYFLFLFFFCQIIGEMKLAFIIYLNSFLIITFAGIEQIYQKCIWTLYLKTLIIKVFSWFVIHYRLILSKWITRVAKMFANTISIFNVMNYTLCVLRTDLLNWLVIRSSIIYYRLPLICVDSLEIHHVNCDTYRVSKLLSKMTPISLFLSNTVK